MTKEPFGERPTEATSTEAGLDLTKLLEEQEVESEGIVGGADFQNEFHGVCVTLDRMSLHSFLLRWVLVVTPSLAMAAEGTLPRSGGGLNDFFQLNEGLPKAVCNEAALMKAPSLEALHPAPDAGSGAGREPLLEVQLPMEESALIGFLLGDSAIRISSPALQVASGGTPTEFEIAKRKLALDVCVAVVTPNRLPKLLQETPSRFLQAQVFSQDRSSLSSQGGLILGARILVEDRASRFGRIGGKWWIPGWLEPYEVLSVRVGRREYRRVAHPVTNLTQLIEVVGQGEMPLGFVFPAGQAAQIDFEPLHRRVDSEAFRARKVDIYLNRIETLAYRSMAEIPAKAAEIRKLQELYRAQLLSSAALSAPVPSPDEAAIRRILDPVFQGQVAQARVNGNSVQFGLLLPDPKLHQIWLDFRQAIFRFTGSRP